MNSIMGLPKSKNDINPYPSVEGLLRVDELMKEWSGKTNFGIEGMTLQDIDTEFVQFFEEKSPPMEGKKLKAFMLANDKWADFKKTWTIRDDDGNILMPYITIRRSNTEKGTRMGDSFKVPQGKKFEYLRIPTVDDDKIIIGYDIYKAPQPTQVDLTFEVSLMARYMVDVNAMDEFIYPLFSPLQAFLNIRGNWMQMVLQSSSMDDQQPLDAEKMYKKDYTILVRGFILNPADIEITKSTKRTIYTTEIK